MDPLPIMGILNSKLITHYLRSVCPHKLQGYRRFNANNLNQIPIPQGRKDLLKRVGRLTQELMELSASKGRMTNSNEIDQIEKQIRQKNDEIDELVFEVYSLSTKNIAIVMAEVNGFTED